MKVNLSSKLKASAIAVVLGITVAQIVLFAIPAKASAADGTCKKDADSICGLNGQNYMGYELYSGIEPE